MEREERRSGRGKSVRERGRAEKVTEKRNLKRDKTRAHRQYIKKINKKSQDVVSKNVLINFVKKTRKNVGSGVFFLRFWFFHFFKTFFF